MSDYSKLVLSSTTNAFKNVNRYSGSLTFPTGLNAGQTVNVTSIIELTDNPVFTQFFANFLETTEAIGLYVSAAGTTPTRWYSGNIPGLYGVGIHVNAPAGQVSWLSCSVYPVINGNTVVVTGTVINPYAVSITLDSLTVPWVFVEYTLAN